MERVRGVLWVGGIGGLAFLDIIIPLGLLLLLRGGRVVCSRRSLLLRWRWRPRHCVWCGVMFAGQG